MPSLRLTPVNIIYCVSSLFLSLYLYLQHITELLQNSKSHFSRSRLAGRARISLSHTVLLSLTLLSKRVSYRSVSGRFRLEKGNIHRIYFSFCERVNLLQDELIRWPSGSLFTSLFVDSVTILSSYSSKSLGIKCILSVKTLRGLQQHNINNFS